MKQAKKSMDQKPDHIECQPGFIPDELKNYDQWVLWAYEYNEEKGKWDKVPFSPKSLRKCDYTNKKFLSDFITAKEKLRKHNGRFAGIGFSVFADDPYVFVDLDDCLNPDDGNPDDVELTLKSKTILKKLDTYTELSPSGRGIRAILKGRLPDDGRKNAGDVELYDRDHYLTLTGHTLPDYPDTIESRPDEILKVHAEYLPPAGRAQPKSAHNKPAGATTNYDKALKIALDTALTEPKFKKLWGGDTAGYPSHSEADLALVGYLVEWLGTDPALIDYAFRKSGLYRPKWDSKRGSSTYGEMTIAKALAGAQPVARKAGHHKPVY